MNRERNSYQVILWTDDKQDSERAKTALEINSVSFSEVHGFHPEPGFDPPILVAAEGEYRGLERIQRFLELVTSRPQGI